MKIKIELEYDFPAQIEHPSFRHSIQAAYLLEYWAKKGVIPKYTALIDGLRQSAKDMRKSQKVAVDGH